MPSLPSQDVTGYQGYYRSQYGVKFAGYRADKLPKPLQNALQEARILAYRTGSDTVTAQHLVYTMLNQVKEHGEKREEIVINPENNPVYALQCALLGKGQIEHLSFKESASICDDVLKGVPTPKPSSKAPEKG